MICQKLDSILGEVEKKMKSSEIDYKKLLKSFNLKFDDDFLTMNQTEIAKLLQKKKETSLKLEIDQTMTSKWQLKKKLKETEKDIKVIIINNIH